MANKPINQLDNASSLDATDLLVLWDSSTNTAQNMTGQQFTTWLTALAAGKGGISSISKTGTAGLVDTYTITYADASTSTFTVTNGAQGDQGEQTYVWIAYSATEPDSDSDMSVIPAPWMGIYVGLESTVLDLCHGNPVILRPGGITRDMIMDVLGEEVADAGSVLRPLQPGEKALSPGMRYRHYAPSGTVTLVDGNTDRVVAVMKQMCLQDIADGRRSCVLCFSEHVPLLSGCFPHDMGPAENHAEIARRLFDILRRLDQEGMETIYSEVIPPEGVGLAVMNRLHIGAARRDDEWDPSSKFVCGDCRNCTRVMNCSGKPAEDVIIAHSAYDIEHGIGERR